MSRNRHHEPMTLEQRAYRNVRLKIGFGIHATVFVLVNAFLYVMANIFGLGHHPVAFFPAWGWSLGLAIHGLVVLLKLQGGGLHDRMVQREMQALHQREMR